MDEDYVKNLEKVIKQMLNPLKDIPLNLVIGSLSGCDVIPFNKEDRKDIAVLSTLTRVAEEAANNINQRGILRSRPNEVGNDIEPFVRDSLNRVGYNAHIPLTKNGKKKATGYPDIEFVDEFDRINYLECKTYNIENVATTQRSFYLSPSEDFKVSKDAHHFVMSYEIYVAGRNGSNNVYKCKHWKILSIEKLLVDVKYEFNSDNLRLYSKELILAEGTL